jgi:ferritin-like metal-binding protein YciE
MPTIDTLNDLLKPELKDLFSAETQIIEALPAMIEAAFCKELKKALHNILL